MQIRGESRSDDTRVELTVDYKVSRTGLVLEDGENVWHFHRVAYRPTPEKPARAIAPREVVRDAVQIATGAWYACARMRDDTVRCWGQSREGQVGDGASTELARPGTVKGLANVQSIALASDHACALLRDGTVRCWGDDTVGQLGDGAAAPRQPPVAVVGVSDVVEITADWHRSCARRTDGSVSCWGADATGKDWRDTKPKEVVALAGATHLAEGGDRTCATLANGDVRCLGGARTQRTQPAQAATPTIFPELAGVAQYSLGELHTCAVSADGTARCWGDNALGELGNGTCGNPIAAPVVVDGVRDAVEISAGLQATCARTRGGAVLCWGENEVVTPPVEFYRCTGAAPIHPTRVTGVAHATSVVASQMHACALEASGAVKCWGGDSVIDALSTK